MAPSQPRAGRHGMTIVELLVVMAILTILAVTVVPNVARNASSRRNREGARGLAAFVAKAQALAIGRRTWSGFAMVGANLMFNDLYLSEVPDLFRGDTVPATLTITSVGSTGTATANGDALVVSGTRVVVDAQVTGTTPFIAANDLIRFAGSGPWYEISGTVMPGNNLPFRMRGEVSGVAKVSSTTESAGYNTSVTPFPPQNTPLSFEIQRPAAISGSPLHLPEGVVVDLRWSGVGPPSVGIVTDTYSTFNFVGTTLTSLHVLFDGTGRLRQAMQVPLAGAISATRLPVTGAVFLLVGRGIRAGNADQDPATFTKESDGANWQYPDSFWVAIDPMTGVTKVAACTTGPYVSGTAGCLNSQYAVRQSLTSDGR